LTKDPAPKTTTRVSVDLTREVYHRLEVIVKASGQTKAAHIRTLIIRDMQAPKKAE
jgi:predicted DNA-binding protein